VPVQDAVSLLAQYDIDILIVGGDAETISWYLGVLHAHGWIADSVPLLPRRLWRRRPRLILLCGWDAVGLFTTRLPQRSCPCPPVVVAYCSPDAEQAADALDRGVDIVIPSPCSLALLVRRLRSALRWAAR
jgi:hypothetical protein